MAIEFRCKQCQTLLRTGDETVGRRAVCPRCGNEMEVPYLSAPAPRRPCPPPEEFEPTAPTIPISSTTDQLAVASLVLGILSLCFSCCCLIGMPMAIAGIVMGIKGLESRQRGLAIAGIVLSGVGLFMSLVMTLLMMLNNGGAFQQGNPNFP